MSWCVLSSVCVTACDKKSWGGIKRGAKAGFSGADCVDADT